MGEILGIGATHYPPGLVHEEHKPWPLARMLHTDARIPPHMRDQTNWPEPMRQEWGDDEGVTVHKAHKARVFSAFRTIREEIDAFQPDFVLMWGRAILRRAGSALPIAPPLLRDGTSNGSRP